MVSRFTNLDPNGSTSKENASDNLRANIDAASDSSSFLRREAELATVEERFRDSHLRKGQLTPVESKFREVFYDGMDAASKRSLLCKLHLTLPSQGIEVGLGKYDGTGSEKPTSCPPPSNRLAPQSPRDPDFPSYGHLNVPTIGHGKLMSTSRNLNSKYPQRSVRSSRGFSSSKDGDETAEMWKRALRAESVARSPRSSISGHKSDSSSLRGGPTNSQRISRVAKDHDHAHHSGADSFDHSPTCDEAPPEDEDQMV